MIAANELRIGNLVVDSKRGISKVISVQHLTVGFLCEGASCHSVHKIIEPIPLTPEILEKCGFERTIGTLTVNRIECAEFYFVKHFYSKITQDYNDRNWFDVTYNYSCGESNEEELLCSVTSLHQLQNLYFALTGEEMAVKL